MKENLAEKLLSKALIEYQDKYSTIFHLSPTFIFMSRLQDGKIIEINDYICQVLGYQPSEVIGKTAFELGVWTQETRDSFYDTLKLKGYIKNYETSIFSKDNKRIDVLVNVQQVLIKKRQCLLIIAVDITEKKRIEQQQTLLTLILKLLNKQDSFSDIFHEIIQSIKKFSNIDSIALRLQDGKNYPFFDTLGFSKEFISSENIIETELFNDLNEKGIEQHCNDCLCNMVLLKKSIPGWEKFTENGSFYSNDLISFNMKDNSSHSSPNINGMCIKMGYKSMALIPLLSRNKVLGLLQLNSYSNNFFTEDSIKFYEEIGSIIGIAFNRILDEKKIKESEIQFRGIYENATIGIYRSLPDGKFVMVNPSLLKMLGIDNSEELLTGKKALSVYFKKFDAYNIRDILFKNGIIHGYESEWVKSDGTKINVRENAVVVKDIEGKIIYYDGTVEDITEHVKVEQLIRDNERRLLNKNREYQTLNEEYVNLNLSLTDSLNRIQKMNKELLIAKEKAEQSDKLKAEFLRNMSHEIRTPMNGIMGFADLMAKTNLKESDRISYISYIKKSCLRLLRTITDIIDYSIISTGQVSTNITEMPLINLLINYENCYQEVAHQKNISFKVKYQGISDEFKLKTDEFKLNQIFVKLIENAINFTHHGSVELTCVLKDTYLEFQICDTGIGIPYEFHSVIFDRFRKAGDQEVNYADGAGLGLTIAKSYVELLNGELWLNSEPNKGSTFCFTLPLL